MPNWVMPTFYGVTSNAKGYSLFRSLSVVLREFILALLVSRTTQECARFITIRDACIRFIFLSISVPIYFSRKGVSQHFWKVHGWISQGIWDWYAHSSFSKHRNDHVHYAFLLSQIIRFDKIAMGGSSPQTLHVRFY